MSLVSVVLPTFNRRHLLVEAITSVLNNTYKDIEIIITDDGNDKDLRDYVYSKFLTHKSKIQVYSHERLGADQNWSYGLEKASGEYIFKLDDDDLIEPTFLEKSVEVLEKHPNVSLVFTGYNLLTKDGEFRYIDRSLFKNTEMVNGLDYAKAIILKRQIPTTHKSAPVFRRSHAKKLRWYTMLTSDIFFTLGLASLGDVYLIKEVLFTYRVNVGPVHEAMTAREAIRSITSYKNLINYEWIRHTKEWEEIIKAYSKFQIILLLFYLLNEKSRNGYSASIRMLNKVLEACPEVKKNKFYFLFRVLLALIPRSILRSIYSLRGKKSLVVIGD